MKTRITLLILAMALVTLGCSREETVGYDSDGLANIELGTGGSDPGNVNNGNNTGSEAQEMQTTLVAGQNIDVGFVDVSVTNGNVTVVYNTDGDWVIEETHLYIGDLNNIPSTGSGNPKIGHFPYKGEHGPNTIFVTYTGPEIGENECVYIAAHAVVRNVNNGQEETAWGEGDPLPGNSWAMAFEYCY